MMTTSSSSAARPAAVPARHRLLRRLAGTAVLVALLVSVMAGLVGVPAAEAAEQRDRIQLVERPRDVFALALYGSLGLITLAGLATMRRQLKGEREQTDGEFRWR